MLLAPKHYASWLLVALLRLLSLLPYKLLMWLGRKLGQLLPLLSQKMRHTTVVNIQVCFPELDSAAQDQLAKKCHQSAGMSIFEAALAWWAPAKRLQPLVHYHGLEHVSAALAEGRGVLLLGTHLSTLQLAGRLYSLDHDFCVVYREQKNAVFNWLIHQVLPRYYANCFARDNIRGVVKALTKNQVVWYTPDTDPKLNSSTFVNFFNQPAATVTIPARLHARYQCALVPVAYYRREANAGYDIVFHPALELSRHDLDADTQLINDQLESMIRVHPEQYLWQYKRFKTQVPDSNIVNPYKRIKT